jgi:hypothetical protein
MKAIISIQRTYEGKTGYVSNVRMEGSVYTCASFFGITYNGVYISAVAWCTKHGVTI